MHHSFKNSFLFMIVVLALLVSAMGVTPVLADDETPPPPATETPVVGQDPVQTEEPVVIDVLPATEAPVLTADPAGTPEPGATEEPAPTESPIVLEEPVTTSVAEALEQLPADTTAVLLDENGNPEPLATQEAADIVQNGDPLWCPAGVTPIPGVGGCTASYTGLSDLLSYLDLNEPTQAGVIWIAGDYDSSINDPGFVNHFTLNGSVGSAFSTMSQYDLTIQGGWSGGNDTLVDHNNPSVFNGDTLAIYAWVGKLTLNDIQIVNTNDSGLTIISYGDVDLDHVTASNNFQIGANVTADGDISVSNSTFDSNGPTSWTCPYGAFCPSPPNNFLAAGLRASSMNGSVSLVNVTARRSFNGAVLFAAGNIHVTDSHFDENNGSFTGGSSIPSIPNWYTVYVYSIGSGLVASSANGSVILDGVTANGNFQEGAELQAEHGNIFIAGSAFNQNGSPALEGARKAEFGLSLQAAGNVFVGCSEFRGNRDYGLDAAHVSGSLTLANVVFAGNGAGEYISNGNVLTSSDCQPASAGSGLGKSSEVPLYHLVGQTQDQLPALLTDGYTFLSALQAVLTPTGEQATNLTLTLSFPIPQGTPTDTLTVLFWNGAEWVPVPGGTVVGNTFIITVSSPGYYVLVSR